jgi:hypothetical protein
VYPYQTPPFDLPGSGILNPLTWLVTNPVQAVINTLSPQLANLILTVPLAKAFLKLQPFIARFEIFQPGEILYTSVKEGSRELTYTFTDLVPNVTVTNVAEIDWAEVSAVPRYLIEDLWNESIANAEQDVPERHKGTINVTSVLQGVKGQFRAKFLDSFSSSGNMTLTIPMTTRPSDYQYFEPKYILGGTLFPMGGIPIMISIWIDALPFDSF